MKHAQGTQQDADARLLAISEQFDRHAAASDDYYANGCPTPSKEYAEEICLEAVGTALLEAAIEIRHRTKAGRAAKERMLVHIERWADKDSVPYDQDQHSLGGRLAASLTRGASPGN